MKNQIEIPPINSLVEYKGIEYKLVNCNMGGKCKIKKTLLPYKGKVLTEIDIKDLTIKK